MVRFEQMCELWLPMSAGKSIATRVVLLFDALCAAFPEHAADANTIARMCGFSTRAIDELRERIAPNMPNTEEDEEGWLSEFYEATDHEEI